MLFNLGEKRFRGFKDMIAAVKRGDWGAASLHARQSKWARQVGKRAERIEGLIRDG
jgi:lysozyme